jgi:DNA polymerase-3 subunit delta
LGEAETEAFISYIQNPVPSTILAFAHKNKTLDGKKRKLNDLLKKNNFIFLSEKIRDTDVPKFILQQIHQLKINAAPNISSLLAEYLGRDLSRIHNELLKLKLILAENELLNDKLVEKHIGISKEYNVFELQNAIGQKNASKAMKIAYYMGQNNKVNPMVLTISRLYEFFTNVLLYQTIYNFPQSEIAKELKIHPFFVKDYVEAARYYPMKFATKAISVIREIDLKSKGLGVNQTTDSELIKELVYKIINIDSIKIKT